MAARSIGSGTITFGLVSVPVKFFSAVSAKSVSFRMLHNKECLTPVKQILVCDAHPGEGRVEVERPDVVRGFEFSRDQYVVFTDEELKALEEERAGAIDIAEFVPARTFNPVHQEKTFYLGADKGGGRAYALLAAALRDEALIGVGTHTKRGKECLVVVAPHEDRDGTLGLRLIECYFAEEVRSFHEDVPMLPAGDPSVLERELAAKLFSLLRRDSFDAERFHDEYGARVHAAVARKVAGETITAPVVQPKPNVVDLLEALKRSVDDVKVKKSTAPGPKKAAPQKAPAKKRKRTSGDEAG